MTTDNIFSMAHYFIDELHIQGPLVNIKQVVLSLDFSVSISYSNIKHS